MNITNSQDLHPLRGAVLIIIGMVTTLFFVVSRPEAIPTPATPTQVWGTWLIATILTLTALSIAIWYKKHQPPTV